MTDMVARSLALNPDWINDKYKIVFGTEYLSSWHKKIMAGTATKIVFSGDSTTAGDYTSGTPFHIDQLTLLGLQSKGFTNITVQNNGQSGATTEQWVSSYLSNDLSANPDLLVLRWGVNDPGWDRDGQIAPTSPPPDPNRNTAQDFEAALQSGLKTIRASHDVSQLTILLMTPNSTYDPPHGRDIAWHESINSIVKKAARDYLCCFIDTFSYLKDSINGGDWMAAAYNDYRHIHPVDVGNIWITSLITDVLSPSVLVGKYGSSMGLIQPTSSPALQNGWSNYDAGTHELAYYVKQGRIVHLMGLIKGGTTTSGTTLFTLESGFIPARDKFFSTACDTGYAGISIDTAGNVAIVSGTNTWFSLDGVSFNV